jgi:heme exporter protein B
MLLNEIKQLIIKDFQLEWRKKYALNGMLLYVVSTAYICYTSFKLRANDIDPNTWNILFWIVILFTAILAISKSFADEKEGRLLYLYTLVSAEAVILSKIVFNFCVLVVLSLLGLIVYSVFMGSPVQDWPMFLVSIVLASIGFATTLSLISGIASKAENSAMLMPILSFPVVIPTLLLVLKISKNALDGLDPSNSTDEILILLCLDVIVGVLSVILYPYLWRS